MARLPLLASAGGRPLKAQEAFGWPILAGFARVGLAGGQRLKPQEGFWVAHPCDFCKGGLIFPSLFRAAEPASL